MLRGYALRTKELSKTFNGKATVQGIDLSVERGEIVGFIGPNGAGKTTVMNMVMGLLEPDSGEIELLGETRGYRDRNLRMRLGYLQEKPRIYPDMTACSYLKFFSDLYGLDRGNERVSAALARVGLAQVGGRMLSAFSRGMQQRVCLARVLLHDPEFIILDEPMLGLDPSGISEMRQIFRELRDAGATLLFSSHQLAEMERVVDSVIFLREGRIVAAGKQESLLPTLQAQLSFEVEIFEDVEGALILAKGLSYVTAANKIGPNRLRLEIRTDSAGDIRNHRAQVAQGLSGLGLTVLSIGHSDSDLESLFLALNAGGSHNELTKG